MRAVALLAALLSSGVCLIAAKGALTTLYLDIAREEYSQNPLSTLASQAPAAAARFSPESPVAQTQIALSHGARGDFDAMLHASRQALVHAPADARSWMQHAYLLAHAGDLGDELVHTLSQTSRLAPSSPDIHLRHALLGIRHWRFAPDPLRQSTLQSLKFLQRHEPRLLHRALLDEREEIKACALLDSDPALQRWCGIVAPKRRQCDAPDLSARAAARCRSDGFLP